jgi:hypothetical protein
LSSRQASDFPDLLIHHSGSVGNGEMEAALHDGTLLDRHLVGSGIVPQLDNARVRADGGCPLTLYGRPVLGGGR